MGRILGTMAEATTVVPNWNGSEGILQHAVDEAARLLRADGAIIYLWDPETRRLRWSHDAGISAEADRHWMRTLELPEGVGVFGRSLVDGKVFVTGDYMADTSFTHA